MSLFKKKEEKSLLQWTIETDGKYQSQLIDLIAERNDRINKAIEYIESGIKYQKSGGYCELSGNQLLKILKGEDKIQEVVSLEELESYEPKNSIEEEYYDEMWS